MFKLAMKPSSVFLSILLFCQFLVAQEKTALEFQKELNQQFKTPEESPLPKEHLDSFESLPFFKIDSTFIIEATFKRTMGAQPFQMTTTTDRLPIYEKYGEATFIFQDKIYTLNIFQNHKLRETEEYKDYLFLPFTDNTNGNQTYGGGRFIDLKIPYKNQILIDFNKAYNPYCAYNHSYSCPIPPRENHLNFDVIAGVKFEEN